MNRPLLLICAGLITVLVLALLALAFLDARLLLHVLILISSLGWDGAMVAWGLYCDLGMRWAICPSTLR